MKALQFLSLGGASIREAQLSDHDPVIKGEVLSWNIMMQGKCRNNRYNNGYGLIETQKDYQSRLKNIVAVLAELIHQNPHISMISLQEGPVQSDDLICFIGQCENHPSLKGFIPSLRDHRVYTNWGLICLVNCERYDYSVESMLEAKDQYDNRIQRLRLIDLSTGESRQAVNLHLPYQGKKEPYTVAQFVYQMMRQYREKYTLMGDFNFTYTEKQIKAMISRLGEVYAPPHNSTELQLDNGGTNTLETVDAIVSNHESVERCFLNLNTTSLLRFTNAYPLQNTDKSSKKIKLIYY